MKHEDQQLEIWFRKFINGFGLEINWEDLWYINCQSVFPIPSISPTLFFTSLIILAIVLQSIVNNGLHLEPFMAEERERLRKNM